MTETEQEELKPCPFCGCLTSYLIYECKNDSYEKYHHMNCARCTANTLGRNPREAAIQWNTRYYEKELTRLRKQEILWKKVCNYEKERWFALNAALLWKMSPEEKAHLKNLEELSRK